MGAGICTFSRGYIDRLRRHGLRLAQSARRHRRERIDFGRVPDPGHEVVRRVREHAVNVDAVGEALERRTDPTLRFPYTRNGVAGRAAALPDRLLAALRVAAGEERKRAVGSDSFGRNSPATTATPINISRSRAASRTTPRGIRSPNPPQPTDHAGVSVSRRRRARPRRTKRARPPHRRCRTGPT
jgi:hypothetical protein